MAGALNVQVTQSYFANGSVAASKTLAYGSNVVKGNLLIVLVSCQTEATINTPTDTVGTTFAACTALMTNGAAQAQAFYGLAAASGANTITATFTSTGCTLIQLTIAEYSGVDTLDTHGEATGTSTYPTSPNITLAKSHELIVGFSDAPSNTSWLNEGPGVLRSGGIGGGVRSVLSDVLDSDILQGLQFKDGGFHTATSQALAFTNPNQAGNLLVAMYVCSSNATPPTISDTLTNTWVKAGDKAWGASGFFTSFFYCVGCKTGANTVTVSTGATSTTCDLCIGEYYQADTIDQGPTATAGASGASVTANITTAHAPNIIIAMSGTNASSTTAQNPFVNRTNDFGGLADNCLQTNRVTRGCAFLVGSGGGGWANWIANFYPAVRTAYCQTFLSSAAWKCGVAAFYKANASSIVVVQACDAGNASAGNTTLAMPAMKTTTGNMLVVAIRNGSTLTANAPTNTGSATWHALTRIAQGAASVQFYYAWNITGNAADIITVTWPGAGAQSPILYAWEVSGCGTTDPFDEQATATSASASSLATASFTTAQAKEVVLTFMTTNAAANGATYSASGGSQGAMVVDDTLPTLTPTSVFAGASHNISSTVITSGTVTMTQSTGTGLAIIIAAAFKQAASRNTNSFLLMGVGT